MGLCLRLVRLIWKLAARILVRWVVLLLPVVLRIIRLAAFLVALSILAILVTPSVAVERASAEWTRNIMSFGLPRIWEGRVTIFTRIGAETAILSGWVILGLTAFFLVMKVVMLALAI